MMKYNTGVDSREKYYAQPIDQAEVIFDSTSFFTENYNTDSVAIFIILKIELI